jgi:2',3'-cyclic-nucleotide 2'-phosphodiesterase (5'-nucleotidase family)
MPRRYTDFVEVGRDLALHLRQKEHCDLVIALTHMRAPNDERLARSVAEIDVVLGGHDHDYVRRMRVEGCASLVPFASAFHQPRPPHTHTLCMLSGRRSCPVARWL